MNGFDRLGDKNIPYFSWRTLDKVINKFSVVNGFGKNALTPAIASKLLLATTSLQAMIFS
jgi:hypothetical protein